MRRHVVLRLLALLALLAFEAALAGTVTGMGSGLLHLAPAVLLLLPLLAGRYVGERKLDTLRRRRSAPYRRRFEAQAVRLPKAPRATIARGGALLAASLAQRGPPASPAMR